MDIDKNRFPLEVIPQSHKKGPLPQVELERGWIIQPDIYKDEDFMQIKCNAGDIVIMSTFMAHRTSINGDDRLRLAFSARFDNGVEPTYIHRCYPTGYKRYVHRQQLFDVSKSFK